MKKVYQKEIIGAILLIILTLFLYFPTLARNIYTEDSAELIAASHTLSVAHPSGYPIYLMSSKLFSMLEISSSVAINMNLFSLLLTVMAIVIFYFSLLKIFKNPLIGFSLSFLFAISPMVWLQATYAEVYSLNTLFIAILLWLYLYYQEKPSLKKLYLFIFFYGLSLTNHYLPLAISPLIFGWLIYKFSLPKNLKFLAKLFGFWILGLTPYLYIPIRTRMNPAFSWFDGDAYGILSYNIAYGHKISLHTFNYLADVFEQLIGSFGIFGLAGFTLGIILMIYYKSKYRYMTLILLFLLSVGIIVALTGGNEYIQFAGWFYTNLYVPFLMISLIPIGYTLKWIFNSKYKMMFFYTCLITILIWPVTEIGARSLLNDRSKYIFLDNYSSSILNSLPANATLFTYHNNLVNDPLVFGLGFQKYVKNLRPDIAIYSLTSIFNLPDNFPKKEAAENNDDYQAFFKKYIEKEFANAKNIYSTFPYPNSEIFLSTSIGSVYKLTPKSESMPSIQLSNYYSADNLYLPSVNDNLFHKSTIAKYYYDLAAMQYSKGRLKSGQWFLIQALEYDPQEFSKFYKNTISIRNQSLDID